MQLSSKEMLDEIQNKRNKMIESARKTGFTSDDTIRYSQELDQLIYDYQRLFQGSNQQEEVKIVLRQMMMIWPKALMNV